MGKGKFVGPKKMMSLYPQEHVVVYTEGNKFGALSYDNKELVPLSNELALAVRMDVKRSRHGQDPGYLRR